MDDNLMVGDPSGPAVTPQMDNTIPDTHQEAPVSTDETAPLILDNNEDYSEGVPQTPETPEETPEAPEAPVQKPEEVPAPQAPAPVAEPIAKPEAPANDYAFDVTLADGTVLRIETPEDIAKLDKDTDFGTPANFLEMQAKYTKMVTGIEADKQKFEEQTKAYEEQTKAEEAQQAQINTLVSELDYLVTKGTLPKVDEKFANVDWATDPEAQKDEGVKAQLALIEYRMKENEAREKAGLPPMGMVDAFNQRQIEQYEQQKNEVQTKRVEQTKAKGAMVHEPSPAPQSNIPDDMMVGEGGDVRSITPSFLS